MPLVKCNSQNLNKFSFFLFTQFIRVIKCSFKFGCCRQSTFINWKLFNWIVCIIIKSRKKNKKKRKKNEMIDTIRDCVGFFYQCVDICVCTVCMCLCCTRVWVRCLYTGAAFIHICVYHWFMALFIETETSSLLWKIRTILYRLSVLFAENRLHIHHPIYRKINMSTL